MPKSQPSLQTYTLYLIVISYNLYPSEEHLCPVAHDDAVVFTRNINRCVSDGTVFNFDAVVVLRISYIVGYPFHIGFF